MQPTRRGLIILLLGALVIGLGTWLPFMEWVGLGYAVFILAIFALDWRRAGPISNFDIARIVDLKLSLGAQNPVTLRISTTRHPRVHIWVRDEPPAAFPIDQRILETDLTRGEVWEGMYHIHPLRRGNYEFANINLRWIGPLGLIVRQGRVDAAQSVKVYPNLFNIRRYDFLLQRNRLQDLGLRHTRIFGRGTEYERLREYLPDDDFRSIAWKATARRNKPVTVEYETERSQNIMLLIDIGRMMQSPVEDIAKLDYVINAVLLLGYVASGVGDNLGLMTFADDVYHYLAPQAGRGQFYRMLEALYAVEPQAVEPNYGRALSFFATRQRKRSLAIIFTDLSGGITMDTLAKHISVLTRTSLPLVVAISDPAVIAAAGQDPHTAFAAYQRAAATELLDDRRLVLERLQRQGVLTLDVPSNQLSISVINRYLELKSKGQI